MKETTVKLYTFDELDETAKAYVIAKFRENYPDQDWSDLTIEDIIEDLQSKGYEDVEIAFSGFWSQGDGASFTGKLNVEKWLELNKDKSKDYPRLLKLLKSGLVEVDSSNIVRDQWRNYVHENTTSVYLNFNMYGNLGTEAINVSDALDRLQDTIQKEIRDLNGEAYNKLNKAYDEITTDEAIIEEIKERDEDYLDTGRIWV